MTNILVDEGGIFYDDNMYEEIPFYENQAAIDGKLTDEDLAFWQLQLKRRTPIPASRFRSAALGSQVDKSHEEGHMHVGSKFVDSYTQDTAKGIFKIYLFQQYISIDYFV